MQALLPAAIADRQPRCEHSTRRLVRERRRYNCKLVARAARVIVVNLVMAPVMAFKCLCYARNGRAGRDTAIVVIAVRRCGHVVAARRCRHVAILYRRLLYEDLENTAPNNYSGK